jgi:uncharacterized RDD family membrane protein YckC
MKLNSTVEQSQSPYASFSRRALARLIDLCVVLTPCAIFYLVNQALGFPVRYTSIFNWARPESATMFMSTDFPGVFLTFAAVKLFIAFPYFALMESSRRQGTIGKQVMRIKVTDLNGARISFGRATGRYFLKMVSSFEFMLGYLISFSDQRQTWHDYIAKTLVVRSAITFSPFYLMPRVSSRWMFTVPLVSKPAINGAQEFAFECIWGDYRSNDERVSCPECGRPGYVRVAVIRGILLMCGVIFTVIGGFLAYTLFWVITDRIADYRLDRYGTPVGVIFIILLATTFCLAGGLSSLFGSKWFIRLLLLVGLGLGRGNWRSNARR